MASTKQRADSGAGGKRSAVATIEEFEATYMPTVTRGTMQGMAGEGEIGLGLVKHVLRDFRRNLRG